MFRPIAGVKCIFTLPRLEGLQGPRPSSRGQDTGGTSIYDIVRELESFGAPEGEGREKEGREIDR